MKLFNKKHPTPTVVEQQRTFGPTKKNKNTYIVQLNGLLCDTGLFAYCKSTPLAVVTKNGETQQDNSGFMTCTQFANPGACEMQANYKKYEPYMGKKMASTIIEYLDYKTGKPVAVLYPDTLIALDGYESDFMSHLNHATRRDLNYQVNIRKAFLNRAFATHNK